MDDETAQSTPPPAPSALRRPYLLPGSLIVAALCVAGALWFTGAGVRDTGEQGDDTYLEIASDDHVRGPKRPDAYVIEYVDYECIFCRGFHPVLREVLADYGDRVAWVVRHLPIDSIHPEARSVAHVAECVAAQGGDEAFWQFSDAWFDETHAGTEGALEVARGLVGSVEDLEACSSDTTYDERIRRDEESIATHGVMGTPHTLIVGMHGNVLQFSGLASDEHVRILLDRALRE